MNPQNTLLATKFNQRRTCVISRQRAYKRTNDIFLTLESELLTCLQFNIVLLHIMVCTKSEMESIRILQIGRLSLFCKSASWLCLCGLDAPPASIEGDQRSSSASFVLLGSFSQFPNDQVKKKIKCNR